MMEIVMNLKIICLLIVRLIIWMEQVILLSLSARSVWKIVFLIITKGIIFVLRKLIWLIYRDLNWIMIVFLIGWMTLWHISVQDVLMIRSVWEIRDVKIVVLIIWLNIFLLSLQREVNLILILSITVTLRKVIVLKLDLWCNREIFQGR